MEKSTHTPEYSALRDELKRVRKIAGMTQRELAEKLGVAHSWIAKVESGERRIDLIEFCWFLAACGADARELTERMIQTIEKREKPKAPRARRSK
jgi:transcriptional regulator with XRE-family HTH domain